MNEDRTTIAVQRYLDELGKVGGDHPAEPVIGALLGRAVGRLEGLCGHLLFQSYPRLTRPPLNLQPEEMLSLVVERLLKAMRGYRPQTVRQFFALANQHMRWELNDLARRLDKEGHHLELHESFAQVGPASESRVEKSGDTQRMLAAIQALPEQEREVLGLVRIQGMTHAEAAQVLGVSVKTVQRRLNRCLVILGDSCGDIIRRDPA